MKATKVKVKVISKYPLKQRTIEDVVREARMFDCSCKNYCLLRLDNNLDEGYKMLMEYMTHWFNMKKDEHKANFLGVLEGCVRGVTEGGHLEKK